MGKKLLFIIFAVLAGILANTVSAATISGTVYNLNLEKMDNAIIGINTEPRQTYVAKNGTYNFNLNPGQYTVLAFKSNGENLELTQKIIIKEEGDYVLDLILFPSIREEEELLNITQYDIGDSYFDKADYLIYWIIAGFIVISLIITAVIILKPRKKEERQQALTEVKDEADKILDFIKKQGGRVTQKDIRKEFPSSEAKISLIITELEHKGKVERIKKGRGNIVKTK
jgi:uncharacterized membrane protein